MRYFLGHSIARMYIGGYSEGVVTNNAIRGVNTAFNFMWVGNYASLCTHTPAGAQACFAQFKKRRQGKCLEMNQKSRNVTRNVGYGFFSNTKCRYCATAAIVSLNLYTTGNRTADIMT